jgi:hemerythrin-like metal-binding protein
MSNIAPLLQWNPSYVLGIPSIDADHLWIVNKINELHDLLHGDQVKDIDLKVKSLLDLLNEYTQEHFKREEKWMACNHCPLREKHAIVHLQLVTLLDQWVVDMHWATGSPDMEGQLLCIISDFGKWFDHHLRTMDCHIHHYGPTKEISVQYIDAPDSNQGPQLSLPLEEQTVNKL